MRRLLTHNVSFSRIRCSDLPCYVTEGFGGRPIEEWPPYTFFDLYLKGEKETAHGGFVRWYSGQLEKYHGVSKKEGGMYKGSLYRLIEQEAQKSFDNVDTDTKNMVISKRVDQRLSLLESIQAEGYKDDTEQIQGVRKKGNVYLCGGHHRAAILRALGQETLPNVLVFPHKTLYSVYTKIR